MSNISELVYNCESVGDGFEVDKKFCISRNFLILVLPELFLLHCCHLEKYINFPCHLLPIQTGMKAKLCQTLEEDKNLLKLQIPQNLAYVF